MRASRQLLLIILEMLSGCAVLYAQPSLQWSYAPIIEETSNLCTYIEPTSSGGCIFAGRARILGHERIWIGELDSSGQLLRERIFTGAEGLYCLNGIHLEDGGILLIGAKYGVTTAYDCFAMKVNSDFDSLWSMSLLGAYNDYFYGGYEDIDGNFILCGTRGVGASAQRVRLIKIDTNGQLVWGREYYEEYDSWIGFHVQPAPENRFLIVGLRTWELNQSIKYLMSYLVNEDSTVQTRHTYTTSAFAEGTVRGKTTSDGGCIVAGLSNLIRLNPNGEVVWSRQYDLTPYRSLTAATELSDGGFLAVGSMRTTYNGRDDFWLIRTDANGDSLWALSYGDSTQEVYLCVTQSTDNAYLIGGLFNAYSPLGEPQSYPDLWVAKTESDSSLPLVSVRHLPIFDSDFGLTSCYPNPFNSTLSISLEVPLHQDVTISLHDLLGREVEVIHQGRLTSNTISFTAPPTLSTGIYFIRAATGEVSAMQKVVLLK